MPLRADAHAASAGIIIASTARMHIVLPPRYAAADAFSLFFRAIHYYIFIFLPFHTLRQCFILFVEHTYA